MLREHQLYAKFNKCEFYKNKIQYLGHVISEEGISVDPNKLNAIIDWCVPKDVIDVWSFMGIIVYYKKFNEQFLKIANPITSLKKKGNKSLRIFSAYVLIEATFLGFTRWSLWWTSFEFS